MMEQIENLNDKQRTNANSRHKAKAFSFNLTDLTQIAYKLNKKSWSIYVSVLCVCAIKLTFDTTLVKRNIQPSKRLFCVHECK